jgi:beta propeller repeat protein
MRQRNRIITDHRKHTRIRVTILLLVIFLLIGIAVGQGTETRISYNSFYQNTPAISGDWIVWTDARNCDIWCSDTYFYDIVTGEERPLRTESDLCEHEMPAISGDYVVWQGMCPPDYDGYDIFLYNLSDLVQPDKMLSENTIGSNQVVPAISDQWVAWKDDRDGTCDIYLYNLLDPNTPAWRIGANTQTCDFPKFPPSPPSISGDRVVWDAFDDANGTYGIHLYNINQPLLDPVRISPIESDQSSPSISGDFVVWEDSNDIYLYNISSTIISPVTNDSYPQYYPRIDGNFIVWEDDRSLNSQVFLYDIQSNSTNQVTIDENEHNFPAISGNRIVWEESWTDGFNDDFDIYMYTIGEYVTCPEADFGNASPVMGNAPLSVEFLDQSSGSPTSWTWEFGDGTGFYTTDSADRSPTHEYTTSGLYDVRLFVSTSLCRDVVEKPGFVSVENKPFPNFSALPLSGYAPLEVNFTDLSTGSPTEWNWDFGDGTWFNTTNSLERNPIHTYSSSGSFTVTLIVNNSYGNNSLTKSSYISVLNRTGITVLMNIPGLVIEQIGDSQFLSFNTSMFPEYEFIPPTTLWFVPPPENGIQNMTLYSMDGIGFFDDNGMIKGNITGVSFQSDPIHLEGFSEETGTDCSVDYLVNLSFYPVNAQIMAYRWEGAIPSDYQLLLKVVNGARFAYINDVAYVIQLARTNMNMLHNASLVLSINSTWVEKSGGRDNIWVVRIGDDQTGEVLYATYLYSDPAKNLDFFQADSPRGLSKFALASLSGTGNPLQIVVLTVQQWFDSGGSDDSGGGPTVTQTSRTSISGVSELVTTSPPEPTPTPEPVEQVPLETPIPTATFPSIEQTTAPMPTTKAPLSLWISGLALAAGMGLLWLVRRRN